MPFFFFPETFKLWELVVRAKVLRVSVKVNLFATYSALDFAWGIYLPLIRSGAELRRIWTVIVTNSSLMAVSTGSSV